DERAAALDAFESARLRQRLKRTLVDRLRIEAGSEIAEAPVWPARAAAGDDALHGGAADVLQRCERIADGAGLAVVAGRLGEEVDVGNVDARWQDGDAALLRLGGEHGELVGVG